MEYLAGNCLVRIFLHLLKNEEGERFMNKLKISALSIVAALGVSQAASAEEITIATVNNADMITMQELAPAS